jgi:hypothetical protein
MLLLTACAKDEAPMAWDGKWQRTITVPKDIQGRCVDETLTIHDKEWFLKIVVHATFECGQPFLELGYAGNIQEIKIKRNTDDKDIRLQVSQIHLAEMADVSGKVRTPLSKSTVAGLSEKYVPLKYQFFEQKVYLSADGKSLQSDVYRPVVDLAIPLYPEGTKVSSYQRVE